MKDGRGVSNFNNLAKHTAQSDDIKYSVPSPVYDTSIAGSSLVVRFYHHRRNSDIFELLIPERNFYNSAQNNHAEQYKKQSRKSSIQQQDFKDS